MAAIQSPGLATSRLPRGMLALVILALALGTFLRAWRIGERPFWRDEAWVAQVIADTSYLGLLRTPDVPLPPLFSMTLKLIHRYVASPEVAFRLLPMLCGAAVPLLMFLAARALRAPRSVALAGVVLGACGYALVNWSRDAKQYSVEAFLATWLAALVFQRYRDTGRRRRARHGGSRPGRVAAATSNRPAAADLRHGGSSTWSAAGILLICLLGPAFGYGLVFPAAAVLTLLISVPPRHPARGTRNRLIGLVALVCLSASALVLLQVLAAGQAGNANLREFWRPYFLDVSSLRSWLHAAAHGGSALPLMLTPFVQELPFVALLLFGALPVAVLVLLGILTWPRRGRVLLAGWVVGPWLLVLMAAAVNRYPFGVARMMSFAAPPLLIAVAAGLVWMCRSCALVLAGRGRPGVVVALLAAAVPAIWVADVPLQHRHCIWHDFPTLLNVLRAQRLPGERVLLTRDATTCVRYYGGDEAKDFTHVPLAAGTVEMRNYDYDSLGLKAVRHAGARCWLLTTSTDSSRVWAVMRDEFRRLRYTETLVGEARLHPDQPLGAAQLFVYEAHGVPK